MPRVLIDNISENHDAWIASKKGHIGSGDIATIVGANEYQTPLKLWAVKTGRELPDPENDFMWWGQMMEKPIAELCGRRLGIPVNYGNKLYAADSPEWATATPDYFGTVATESTNEDIIVECKNVGFRQGHKWVEETPLAPRIQVMWQLGVTGFKRGIIAPLIGGDILDFSARWVDYDQKIFEQLIEMADKFMWHVRNDVPPPPTGEDAKLVDKIIGELEDETATLNETFVPLLSDYKRIKELESHAKSEMERFKEQADEIKNKLRFAIGANRKAICGPYAISCTPVHCKEKITKAYDFVRFTVKGGVEVEPVCE